jgi:ferredoxin-nitrite reductase
VHPAVGLCVPIGRLRVPELLDEPLVRDELRVDPPLFIRGVQTCTGKEFCGLAKVFTKERAAQMTAFLNEHVRANGHGEDLRLHFAGCSSGCAQHQIADIGIEGVLKRVDGEMIEAMDIRIGGRLGPDARFGDVVVKKVPHWGLNAKLLEIFDLYERHHHDEETFREFAARTTAEWWTEHFVESEPADGRRGLPAPPPARGQEAAGANPSLRPS